MARFHSACGVGCLPLVLLLGGCASSAMATPVRAPHHASASGTAYAAYARARATVDADSAARLYRAIVRDYPRDSMAAWSLLRLMQYDQVRGDSAAIRGSYALLAERFPRSSALAEARAFAPARAGVRAAPSPPAAPRVAPAPARPSAPSGVVFTIQLGAYAVAANAHHVRDAAARVTPTDVVERHRGALLLHCVLAGSFASRDEAARMLPRLATATGVTGVIVLR